MDAIVAALVAQQTELAGLLAGLDEDGWARPSRCDGWSVADVVLHLAQTNEMAIGSATGRYAEVLAELTADVRASADAAPGATIDDGAALMVEHQRGEPGPVVSARWRASADTLVERLQAADPHRRVTWVAGQLSVHTLTTTRLAETWIHTGDVADALGTTLAPTDRLRHVARLAWRTLPYAFARGGRELHGPVAFDLRGPDGDSWDFVPDTDPVTTIHGDGYELCLVAGQRARPEETGLRGEGPDADAVLELVRTYA